MAVGKRCRAPRGGGSARRAIRYVLGEELTAKVQHERIDDPLTAVQRNELAALLDESRRRPDFGVGVVWRPEASGPRPSAVYARGVMSLATAAEEIQAIYATQPRVKSPVVHYVISLSEAESKTVDDEQLIRFAERVLDRAGWEGHAGVFAVHRDQPNAHCHVAISSVHSGTLRAYVRQGDFGRLHRALRETELELKMAHDWGLYVVRDEGLATQRVEKVRTEDWARRKRDRGQERLEEQGRAFVSDEEGLESPQDRRDRVVHALRTYLERCAERGEQPLRADLHSIAARLTSTLENGDGRLRMRLMERAPQGSVRSTWADSFGEVHSRAATWVPTETVFELDPVWIAPSPLDASPAGARPRKSQLLEHEEALRRRAWLTDLGDLERSEAEYRGMLAEDPGRVSRDIAASGQATFTPDDVDAWISDRLTDPEEWFERANEVLRKDPTLEVLSLDSELPLYATKAQRWLEQRVADDAGALAAARDLKFDRAMLNRAIADEQAALGIAFSQEQLAAFELVERRFGVLQGNAGSAKTTLMSVLRRYAELTQRPIVGFATAQLAAETLGRQAKIDAVNQARARAIEAAGGSEMIKPNALVIVDEASMVSFEATKAIFERAKEQNATVVAIGDEAQLPNIDAGDTMRVLAGIAREHHAYREVKLSYRPQVGSHVEWMRKAIPRGGRAIREQDGAAFRQYLGEFFDRGNVVCHGSREDEIAAKAADIVEATSRGVRVLAPVRSRTDALYTNRAIRHELGLNGTGIAFRFERGVRELAVGDRVLFERNSKTLDVLNGYLGTVRAVASQAVDVELDGGRTVQFDPRRYRAIDYGWSTTTHKSQSRGDPLVVPTLGKNDDARSAHVALTRCESGLRVHTRLGREELVERLCSSTSLRPKDDALLFDELVQRTGGPDTMWARTVRRALEHDRDPLRRQHRAEMAWTRDEQSRELRRILEGNAAARQAAEALPEPKRHKELARLERVERADVAAACEKYRLVSFVAWAHQHREQVQREAELQERRRHFEAAAIRRHEEARRREATREPPTPAQLDRLACALRGCAPIAQTPGEAYLRGRGLETFDDALYAPSWYRGCVRDDGHVSRGLGPAAVFLVRDAAGEVVAAQGRLLEPLAPRASDETPLRMVTVGAVSGGVFATPGAFEADTVAIVEAPIDALSLAQYGLPAIATCGTQNRPEWVRRALVAREVVIATDADLAGEQAAVELSKWLSSDSTLARLRLPAGAKDPNEALLRDPDQLRLEIGIALHGVRNDLQRAWRAEWRKALGAEPPVGLERAIDRDGLERTMLDRALGSQGSRPLEPEIDFDAARQRRGMHR